MARVLALAVQQVDGLEMVEFALIDDCMMSGKVHSIALYINNSPRSCQRNAYEYVMGKLAQLRIFPPSIELPKPPIAKFHQIRAAALKLADNGVTFGVAEYLWGVSSEFVRLRLIANNVWQESNRRAQMLLRSNDLCHVMRKCPPEYRAAYTFYVLSEARRLSSGRKQVIDRLNPIQSYKPYLGLAPMMFSDSPKSGMAIHRQCVKELCKAISEGHYQNNLAHYVIIGQVIAHMKTLNQPYDLKLPKKFSDAIAGREVDDPDMEYVTMAFTSKPDIAELITTSFVYSYAITDPVCMVAMALLTDSQRHYISFLCGNLPIVSIVPHDRDEVVANGGFSTLFVPNLLDPVELSLRITTFLVSAHTIQVV